MERAGNQLALESVSICQVDVLFPPTRDQGWDIVVCSFAAASAYHRSRRRSIPPRATQLPWEGSPSRRGIYFALTKCNVLFFHCRPQAYEAFGHQTNSKRNLRPLQLLQLWREQREQ